MPEPHTTVAITLGHENLTTNSQEARFLITDGLNAAGATFLTVLYDGVGTWAIPGQEQPFIETCDMWVISIPTSAVADLRALMQAFAATLGQDALGFLVHDGTYGPSYVEAP